MSGLQNRGIENGLKEDSAPGSESRHYYRAMEGAVQIPIRLLGGKYSGALASGSRSISLLLSFHVY